jgi:hypothetical protein
MSIPIKIKTLLVFLFYNIHTLSYEELHNSITSIHNCINEHSISIKNTCIIKKSLITLIFHTRNTHYGGLGEKRISTDILFILYTYYPEDIIRVIELYIYYGSFSDINSLIRFSSYDNQYKPIAQKCYELYAKYLLIDYYKIKYFIEHRGTSVSISDCVKYIPKENKNLDKRTNATHEIVKLIYPTLYDSHKHSALKKFRKIYQPILSLRTQSEQTTEEKNNIYKDISFTSITSTNIYVRALANTMYSIPEIYMRHHLDDHLLSNYRLYIIDYLWFTHNVTYTHNIDIYGMKHNDPDTLRYMLSYYNAHMDYFWNTIQEAFHQDCYNSIYTRLELIESL